MISKNCSPVVSRPSALPIMTKICGNFMPTSLDRQGQVEMNRTLLHDYWIVGFTSLSNTHAKYHHFLKVTRPSTTI